MNPDYRAEIVQSERRCAKALIALSVVGIIAVASAAMIALAY